MKSKKRIISFILCLTIIFGSIPFTSNNSFKAAENEWNFDFTGDVEEFTAPYTGKYLLETWGAQGGGVLSKGGYSNVYVNLYAGEKIYVCVGEQGSVAPEDGKAEGGYNGGGAAWYGAGSGGGATSITKTNRGELKNFEEYKDEILIVAGGSGGKGSKTSLTNIVYSDDGEYRSTSNYYTDNETYRERVKIMGAGGGYSAPGWQALKTEYDTYVSTFADYNFGVGEDGTNTYNSGYAGAGGGGFVGGGRNYYYLAPSGSYKTEKYNKSIGTIGGAGGSGFVNDIIAYDGDSVENVNEGNGKAKISWKGEVETTLTIDTKDHSTVNGERGKVELKGIAETTINMPQIDIDEGYRLYEYKILYGDDFDLNADTYEFTFNDTFVELQYINPLVLELEEVSKTEYNLNFTQDDGIKKIFRVLQSYDGETWVPVQSNKNKEELEAYSKGFQYTGSVQSYTAPIDGYYYIEATGASGGACKFAYTVYSNSGFTNGYRYLKAGQTIYVAVGGKGTGNTSSTKCNYSDGSHQAATSYRYAGGWNGGGSGFGDQCASGGGGATSWTLTNRGELRNFSSYRDEVIAVAGGGGGGNWGSYGNAGGGLTGQGHSKGTSYSTPGGQTSGYAFGYGESRYNLTDTPWNDAGGGGGGWYGGTSAKVNDGSGAGGSGYIGGLFNAQTILGAGKQSKLGVTPYGTAYIDVYEIIHNNSFLNDIVLKDEAAPNTPSDGKYDSIGNTITVTWEDNGDNGTDVSYKVISYKEDTDMSDLETAEILNESNIVPFNYTSGVKGFYYYIDGNPTGTVTKNHTFTENAEIEVPTSTSDRYLHVAAVDNVGNISGTYTMLIPSIAKYTVNHYAQNEDGTYTLVETEEFMDTIGKTVTPEVHPQTGRDNPPAQSVVISADGSTTVNYYYDVTRFDINGTVQWNDHNNEYGTRPEDIKVTIYRDGEYFDEVIVSASSNSNSYTIPGVQKYDLETGREFVYTAEQETAYSQAALSTSEDKYLTKQSGFNFLNTINNTNADKPEKTDPDNPDDKGFYIEGNIYWDDNNDSLGFRPSEVTITLYQKGEDGEFVEFDSVVVDANNENYYLFDWLPKYWYDEDGVPTKYEYKVEETFTSWYVEDGVIKDAYEIHPDTPKDCDFTNSFVFPDKPIIPVNEYTNTLTVVTNTEEEVRIILKPEELIVNPDYSVSYGDPTGDDIPAFADKTGTVLTDLPSTRYEIVVDSPEYDIADIDLVLPENMKLEKVDDKWYLIIENQPGDAIGTLEIELTKKDKFYQDRSRINNYFACLNKDTSEAATTNAMSLFGITTDEEPVSETTDTNIDSDADSEITDIDSETEDKDISDDSESSEDVKDITEEKSDTKIVIEDVEDSSITPAEDDE